MGSWTRPPKSFAIRRCVISGEKTCNYEIEAAPEERFAAGADRGCGPRRRDAKEREVAGVPDRMHAVLRRRLRDQSARRITPAPRIGNSCPQRPAASKRHPGASARFYVAS